MADKNNHINPTTDIGKPSLFWRLLISLAITFGLIAVAISINLFFAVLSEISPAFAFSVGAFMSIWVIVWVLMERRNDSK